MGRSDGSERTERKRRTVEPGAFLDNAVTYLANADGDVTWRRRTVGLDVVTVAASRVADERDGVGAVGEEAVAVDVGEGNVSRGVAVEDQLAGGIGVDDGILAPIGPKT